MRISQPTRNSRAKFSGRPNQVGLGGTRRPPMFQKAAHLEWAAGVSSIQPGFNCLRWTGPLLLHLLVLNPQLVTPLYLTNHGGW